VNRARLLVLLLALITCTGAHAQSAAALGSIAGTVLDPQGRTIPAAHVTIRNADSGLTRTAETDNDGRFSATFLPAGAYLVQVKAPGFELKKPPRVTLGAGASVQVAIKLTVTGASESVTVRGTAPTVEGNTVAPAVNKQDPAVSNTIAGLTVTYLPNRARDFTQFAQLSAGTAPDPDSNGISISGQRPENTAVAVDGAAFNNPLRGGQRGAADGAFFFPQTVVREFQVVHAGATAEIGGTNAGFVNVVTKSGTNKRRGEAFYIGRPAALTSADPFGHELDNAQNEFGGSVGGPIKKDRAFYYLGFEQDFLNVPYWTQFAPQAPGVTLPAQFAGLQHQTVERSRPTALFGRIDLMLGRASTLNLQINYNRVSATNLNLDNSTRTLRSPDNTADLSGHSLWARANLTSVLRTSLVNQALIQWGRDRRDLDPVSTAPEVFINGFGVLGGNSTAPHHYTSNDAQFSDDLALTRGGSTLRVGGFFAYDPARDFREPFLNGRFDFNSLADFNAGNIRRFQQTFLTGDATYHGSIRRFGLYIDARRQITAKFTLSAGLRWEGQWNPQLGPATLTNSLTSPSLTEVQRIPNDLAQWQPRLGLAWNPRTSTVVRLSAGLYDSPTPASVFARAFTDNGVQTRTVDFYFDPQLLPLVSGLQPLTTVPVGLSTISSRAIGLAPGFRNPRSFQGSASVEQQVTKSVSVTGGYQHSATWALQTLLDTNLFAPTLDATGLPVFPTARPDTTIGQLLVNDSNAHSSYDALLLTGNAQIGRRSTVMVNYTLARTRDNTTQADPFRRIDPLDPFNLGLNATYSDLDIRHNFNLSAVYNLPLGFKINPILIARSGAPYTPIVGFDLQNDANDFNDRAILNGTVAGRNSLRQPAFANLDLRFVKDITLRGEGHHLDLFMDVFNITGASNLNFGPEPVSFFGTSASPVFSAGQALFAPATTRFGSARQVQFTARIVAF
jgi:hypothetical protein